MSSYAYPAASNVISYVHRILLSELSRIIISSYSTSFVFSMRRRNLCRVLTSVSMSTTRWQHHPRWTDRTTRVPDQSGKTFLSIFCAQFVRRYTCQHAKVAKSAVRSQKTLHWSSVPMIHRGPTSSATFYYVYSHCGVQPEKTDVF